MATNSDSVQANITRFDAEAAAWDANLQHRHCSELALKAITAHVPRLRAREQSVVSTSESLHVLDLGCGTGLLSFMLLPYVDTLVGVDASTGMTDALNAKIAQRKSFGDSNATKLAAVCTLLEDPADPKLQAVIAELRKSEVEGQLLRFDLVVSHLMLHHIPSLKDILATMLRCLDEGGMVALTDFEDFGEDAILFHPESKRDGVERHGIKKEEMEKLMIDAGFVDVRIERPFELKKQVELEHGKAEMAFPFLLCLGRKP